VANLSCVYMCVLSVQFGAATARGPRCSFLFPISLLHRLLLIFNESFVCVRLDLHHSQPRARGGQQVRHFCASIGALFLMLWALLAKMQMRAIKRIREVKRRCLCLEELHTTVFYFMKSACGNSERRILLRKSGR
jgi:hypothetical protein